MNEYQKIEPVTVGLDVGTSALKATVYVPELGSIVENISFPYLEDEISLGFARGKRYLDAVVNALTELGKRHRIKGVALSTQMYSFMAEKEGEEIVCQWNSVWSDVKEAFIAVSEAVPVSGCPAALLFPSYKILAARVSMPELTIRPYGLQEYLTQALTGRYVVDHCCASASGFRNILDSTWNEELLKVAGFSVDDVPKIVEFNQAIGTITHESLQDMAPMVFATGMGDGPSASYATYGITKITANLGTSLAVRAFVTDPSNLDFSSVWCYAVREGLWVAGAISSNGCIVLDKFRQLGVLRDSEVDPATVDASIQFYPWENGERSPYWSSKLRETLIGGQVGTTVDDYGASVVRGIAFTVARMFEEIYGVSSESDIFCVAGGGAKSRLLLNYLAGAIKSDIGLLEDFDYLGARGAAYAAAEALGAEVIRSNDMSETVQSTGKYRANYEKWCRDADSLAAWHAGRD